VDDLVEIIDDEPQISAPQLLRPPTGDE